MIVLLWLLVLDVLRLLVLEVLLLLVLGGFAAAGAEAVDAGATEAAVM